MEKAVTYNLKFGLIQGFYYSAICVSFSYFIPYFIHLGMDDLTIGIVNSVMMASTFFAQPLIGVISSRLKSVKPLLAVLISVSAIAVLLLRTGTQSMFTTVASVIIIAACFRGLGGIVDVWSVRITMAGVRLNYGFTRGMGSLFYSITAISFGYLLNHFEITVISYAFVLFCMLTLVAVMLIKEPAERAVALPTKRKQNYNIIYKNPQYMAFLIAAFLVNIGANTAFNFLPTLMYYNGADSSVLGITLFVSAMFEIPAMLCANYIKKYISIPTLMKICFAAYFVKVLLTAAAPTSGLIIAAQTLQLLGGGIQFTFTVQYLAKIVKSEELFYAQTTLNAWTVSASGILGGICAGYIITAFGVVGMYYLALIPIALGVLLFVVADAAFKRKRVVET